MKVNDKNYDVDDLVNKIEDTTFLKNYGNGILLNQKHIDILSNYDIDYRKYNSISSLIFDIQEYLDDSYLELDDLEWVLDDLSERNYYQNTNK